MSELIDEVQAEIWSEFGVDVLINGHGPVRVIKHCEVEHFSDAHGLSKQLLIRLSDPTPSQGDAITFVKSGKKAVCINSPYEQDKKMVVLYEYDR